MHGVGSAFLQGTLFGTYSYFAITITNSVVAQCFISILTCHNMSIAAIATFHHKKNKNGSNLKHGLTLLLENCDCAFRHIFKIFVLNEFAVFAPERN